MLLRVSKGLIIPHQAKSSQISAEIELIKIKYIAGRVGSFP